MRNLKFFVGVFVLFVGCGGNTPDVSLPDMDKCLVPCELPDGAVTPCKPAFVCYNNVCSDKYVCL